MKSLDTTAKIWSFDLKACKTQIATKELSPAITTNTISVLVGGCFDVLHYGHIKFLQAAKALGGDTFFATGDVFTSQLIIALEPDEKILQSKNRRPIHNQMQRAEILAQLRFVDEIILLPLMYKFEDYLQLVKEIAPKYLAITAGDPQLPNKQKQADLVGAELVLVTENITSFSSSHLIKEKDWI